jgi:hypothetical protein
VIVVGFIVVGAIAILMVVGAAFLPCEHMYVVPARDESGQIRLVCCRCHQPIDNPAARSKV